MNLHQSLHLHDAVFLQQAEVNGYNQMFGYPSNWSLNHTKSYTDLRQQVADAVQNKGSANVRTGYTHAGQFKAHVYLVKIQKF